MFVSSTCASYLDLVSCLLAFDGTQLTREIILLHSPATAPEKKLLVLDGV
jgi:hypothetical protein